MIYVNQFTGFKYFKYDVNISCRCDCFVGSDETYKMAGSK